MSSSRPAVQKRILDPRRVRRIREGFSWIDRRFVGEGWLERLVGDEFALYFFLVAVADKDGLSFYSDRRIMGLLRVDGESFFRARGRLLELGLIAWEAPLYQVLELPSSIGEGYRSGARS
jgi:hypothetical protein